MYGCDGDRFASEIFRDIHEELITLGGRGHDLTVRVRQLEAELPTVEKTLLSEPNQLRFAYTNGMLHICAKSVLFRERCT